MRKYLTLLLLFFAIPCFAQGFRIGDDRSVTGVQTPGGPLFSVSNAGISVCANPANAVPCTNKITTYTDITLGTPCSTSTQVTLIGSTSCVGTSDQYGNWGVWVPAGIYSYTITLPGGGSIGPYIVTLSSGGGGGGGTVTQVTFSRSTLPYSAIHMLGSNRYEHATAVLCAEQMRLRMEFSLGLSVDLPHRQVSGKPLRVM